MLFLWFIAFEFQTYVTIAQESVLSLDDIAFWIGDGPNSAALVIDWDGQSSSDNALVWGYRWTDAANGTAMLTEVLTADPRLYVKLSTVAGLGTAIVGVGYDQNDDGLFELTDGAIFDEFGIHHSGLNDGESSVDPGDLYAEGWFLGYWHVGFATSNPFESAAWSSSPLGTDNVNLTDQSWLSLAFTTDTNSTTAFPENPIAAEPPFSADFDLDGDVDGSDFLAWQHGFGTVTDATDLQLWTSAYGDSSSLGAVHSVPESCSMTYVIVTLTLLGAGSIGPFRTLRISI